MRKAVCLAFCLLLLAFFPARAFAAELYAAGEDGQYPVSYYDGETGEYRGILPELLEAAAERSGLSVRWLEGDLEELTENLQVELVAGIDRDEAIRHGLEPTEICLTLEEDGVQRNLGFAFTQAASAEQKRLFREGLAAALAEDKEEILLSYLSREEPSVSPWLWAAAGAAVLLALLAAAAAFRAGKKRGKAAAASAEGDAFTGAPGYESLRRAYETLVNETSRPLYCVVDLEVENLGAYCELFGLPAGSRAAASLAGAAARAAGPEEACAAAHMGHFYLLLKYYSNRPMQQRLEELTGEMSRYGEDEDPYRFAVHAGAYRLSDKDEGLEEALFYAAQARRDAAGAGRRAALLDEAALGQLRRRYRMEQELLLGFRREEFLPYFQPKADLKTGKLVGAEALARWLSSSYGLLSTHSFIPVLERNRLIGQLDFWIFEQVCRILAERREKGEPLFPVSCNFSRASLADEHLPEKLRKLADQCGVAPALLEIEVTESVLGEDAEKTASVMEGLKNEGFSLALDDFGTGYSSFHSLEEFQVDCLKIDKTLLHGADSPKTVSVLESIVHMAHCLGAKALCEGVENEETARMLQGLGCDYAQGYLYGQPMPYQQFCRLLERRAEP
ncbi:MAG TPA: EAL domain-containing protein [Candidatus Caccousia avistercoris]|nr:EAL domain-containing protein [Candidatus Caccousia avistercoris]